MAMSTSHHICVLFLTVLLMAVSETGSVCPEIGCVGNRRLRGSGSIRPQEQQQQQRLRRRLDPLADFLWLTLHHHHHQKHDPLPLHASHRKNQVSFPKNENEQARSTYVQQCASFLFSSDVINDGIISQVEFVDMLLHQCRLNSMCNESLKLNFGQLDVGLRVKFIRGICSGTSDHRERFECIYNLYEMMRNESIFGFDANAVGVEGLVKDVCHETYLDAVDFGFVETQGLTNSPSSEFSLVPSVSPSETDSMSPSSSPSTATVSYPPTSAATLHPTSLPSLESTSAFPSEVPSTFTAIDNGTVDSGTSGGNDDSLSIGGIAGITSAALFVTVAFVAFVYLCTGHMSSPDMKSPKDLNNVGMSAHDFLGKSVSSLPIPYRGLNCSVCSSSSSYRDYRFVNVFGPQGTPIPQFNPSTAGAVVIGSVTIRASSSYSSGPFDNSVSSQVHSRSIFRRRKRAQHRQSPSKSGSGISSRDDLSSISSRKSSFQGMKHRASKSRRKMVSMRLDRRNISHDAAQFPIGSLKSSLTVPLSYRQRQKLDRQLDIESQVSFGDWRATWDLSACRPCDETTDDAVIRANRKILFNTLCPESYRLSDENMTPPSSGCHSLPNMHIVPRAGSSDAGSSSILSESYFLDGSSLRQQQSVASSAKSTSTSPFVPWRSEGFISSRTSDSKHSNESDVYSSSKSNVPEMKKRFDVIRRPAKAVFAKYKRRTGAKDWFSFRSSRQYHYLNKQDGVAALQDDQEVLSLNSYSSNAHLLPPSEESEKHDMPTFVLGTFAAASMPIGQKVPLPFVATSSATEVNDGVIELTGKKLDCADDFDQPFTDACANIATEPFSVAYHGENPTIRTRTVQNISSLDANVSFADSNDSSSISAYSRSDFELSSSSPSKTISDSSYCSPATADTSQSIVRQGMGSSFSSLKKDVDEGFVVSSNVIMEDCVNDESSFVGDTSVAFNESKLVVQLPGTSQEDILGKKPSLLCDSNGCTAFELNVVSNSGSETGNFLFPFDEENDDAVDRCTITGKEHAPNLITPIEPSTFFAE